jgi:nitroreductase
MDFFKALEQRKSIRNYAEKDVENHLIEKIADAGRLAATARNEQPWEFIIASDKNTLKKIADICPNGPFIENCSRLIAVFSKDTKYYLEDCSAAIQNMLLAIEALSLGGCWVAGDKKEYAEEIRKIFEVPESYKLAGMISVGYPEKTQEPKTKRKLKEMIHWEKW